MNKVDIYTARALKLYNKELRRLVIKAEKELVEAQSEMATQGVSYVAGGEGFAMPVYHRKEAA